MTIDKLVNGSEVTLQIGGRLDTNTSKDLEKVLMESVEGCTSLIFDLATLEYTSSAGLRVLLNAQKIMKKQGSMVIRNVNAEVMEIFEVTGFVDILMIE